MRVYSEPDFIGGGIMYRKSKYEHDPELLEAYECGKKDGWREAMEESEHRYAERHTMPPIMRERDNVIRYRDDDWDDPYMERRRRDSRGRYM